jgi:hypothetical protein
MITRVKILRLLAILAVFWVVFSSQFGFVRALTEVQKQKAEKDLVDEWIESFEEFFKSYVVAGYILLKTNKMALVGVLALFVGFHVIKASSFVLKAFSRV